MAVDQKAYRRYHAAIERALTLFDANSDWADYIAFLSRLLKSLEAGKPDGSTEIPCKTKVALCLSRCLQPSMPSGVHQKALDVYGEIFLTIGVEGLSRDLNLYLAGLSHTLAFANLSTRPMVLDLFETYVLKLPISALRPAMKSLILSILPVIEEEASEDFDRCLHTFDTLRLAFAQDGQESFFWQTLFVASIANPLRRTGVLVYSNRFLPKLGNSDAGLINASNVITSPEPGLLLRCFATGLYDDQPLVQRGFLDLLVTHLPLHATVLQADRYRKDLDVLVRSAMMVVLRRDMSLNRRLWAWFTGIDNKTQETPATPPLESAVMHMNSGDDYFVRHGLQAIIRGIQFMVTEQSAQPGPRTIPFRIMLSLLDRWEIGGPVVQANFLLMMKNLMNYQSSAPSQGAFDEVFRSANVFFDSIESTPLFDCLWELLRLKELDLLSFVVANFNIEQVDMVQVHVARLSCEVAKSMEEHTSESPVLTALLNDLTMIIPPTKSTGSKPDEQDLGEKLLEAVTNTVCAFLDMPDQISSLISICPSFERAMMMSSSFALFRETPFLEKVRVAINQRPPVGSHGFAVIDSCSKIVASMLQQSADLDEQTQVQVLDLIPTLTETLWSYMSTKTPQFHVAAVEGIWRLHEFTSEMEVVESTILDILNRAVEDVMLRNDDKVERFGVFYHHTRTVRKPTDDTVPSLLRRPSLRILDGCRGEDRGEPEVQWLLSLNDTSPIFKLAFDTDLQGSQNVYLLLKRIQKLVRILQMTEDHWRAFGGSEDMQLIHDFCITLIEQDRQTEKKYEHDAFSLLRTIYDSRTGNTPPDELVSLLVDKLDSGDASLAQQEEVLDTLLAILNDKSLLPSSLVQVLLQGLSTIPTDERLDKWITLLCNFLPNHAALLPSLLKVTSSFCKRIEQSFDDLQSLFNHSISMSISKSPDQSITNLLSGLEYVLARAHQQIFHNLTPNTQLTNGVASETVSSRSRANDRLTVILCMQDAVRICAKLWSWKTSARTGPSTSVLGDIKSFQYTATKLRARSRKILENLIEAEPQECLETLVGMWVGPQQNSILDLLQTLNGARPRAMMPAVFNAIYSRANPVTPGSSKKSSVSIQINPRELTDFLHEYTTALEDDMLEEIWGACATFLREVLANPMPHRQILIRLLRFCSTLSRKIENTSFGEDSKMLRELADICARLFTAIFTIKPTGFDGLTPMNEKAKSTQVSAGPEENMLAMLVETLPHLAPLLAQSDRLNPVYVGIATNITSPSFHTRSFPQNLTIEHLTITRLMSTSAGASKAWRKDVLDGFGNPKFFQSSTELANRGWLPLIKQLQTTDKTTLPESIARIAPPAAAGIMLGIGANAARTEADRKTQLELKRIATLVMATEIDASLPYLQQLFQKIEELLGATVESSPSLATRGDIYLLIRVILLKVTHSNLALLWPTLDSELQSLCQDILSGIESKHTAYSKLQGAKLLDLLLLMRPDEFQLHEWLFVTDTIDAIYPSSSAPAISYADEIAPTLNANGIHVEPHTPGVGRRRKPWLYGNESRDLGNIDALLAGFFAQLSIRTFEDLYSLQQLDWEACQEDVLADIFTDTST